VCSDQNSETACPWGAQSHRDPWWWENLGVDFIVELPEAHGHDVVMVVADMLGKCAHFIECHTSITALGTARLYYRHVRKHHGMPLKFFSDCGPLFVADFTKEL
jgi:hypothetical protein